MAKNARSIEDLSVAELEALLARKRREARQERVRKFQRSGRALDVRGNSGREGVAIGQSANETVEQEGADEGDQDSRARSALNRILLFVEIAAVVGLALILVNSFGVLQELNQEVAAALGGATPSPTPVITAVVLPSGHTPPTSPGGARPNVDEIPENLRPLVQSTGPVDIPTPGPSQARSVHIPALWNAPAPVVEGDGWEQLKKGVGHHIGSANPGQDGNMVLSAHNDIYGELFRHLDRLSPGDEIILTTATREYTYRVTGMQVVQPTEVDVMKPTDEATVTLISCYPYLVDNKRIVVFAELAES